MFKFFRKIRKNLIDQSRLTKYLLYAIGEILLVVIGILIALQINNWNQNKINTATLNGYLNTISNNIKEDIQKIESIRQIRTNAIDRIPFILTTIVEVPFIEKKDIKYCSETISMISDLAYLNTDQSGFESVKSSGFLSKLQGKDIENLIYKYYNLVQEIERMENDFNESLKTDLSEFRSERNESMYYLTFPDHIAGDKQLQELQPSLRKIIFHPSAIALYLQTSGTNPRLIVKYDNLKILGNEIIRMVNNKQKSYDSIALNNLDNLYNLNDKTGYSTVLKNGKHFFYFYEIGHAVANNAGIDVLLELDHLSIKVPEADWATVYIRNPSNVQADRPTKDFSSYSSLKLELKGEQEGETVLIALKDGKDPDDGTETMIPLTLSSEWKTYEIDLSEFKTADLKDLFVVTSFVFQNKAQKLGVRSIEYVR